MTKTALLIGAGGLGCPAALALARSGVALTIVDDDRVDETNLHRQVLFRDEDGGADKAERAAARLAELTEVRAVHGRFLPHTAGDLLEGVDVVVEGADNFATKFLAADACAIHRVPLVQAGAVRWSGWALATRNERPHRACLRCVFEDVPAGHVETCAEAGVVGPVVGVLGALEAVLALRILRGDDPGGLLYSYRALDGVLRRSRVRARAECPHANETIQDLDAARYLPRACTS